LKQKFELVGAELELLLGMNASHIVSLDEITMPPQLGSEIKPLSDNAQAPKTSRPSRSLCQIVP
jgi:hypothetical protein